ncbi:MAG: hypothetical protein WB579_25510 [Bryobacteraceae bacterium]
MRETDSSRNLYEIAEPQYGFFTTKQAKEAGYDESKHAYHVRAAGELLGGDFRGRCLPRMIAARTWPLTQADFLFPIQPNKPKPLDDEASRRE